LPQRWGSSWPRWYRLDFSSCDRRFVYSPPLSSDIRNSTAAAYVAGGRVKVVVAVVVEVVVVAEVHVYEK